MQLPPAKSRSFASLRMTIHYDDKQTEPLPNPGLPEPQATAGLLQPGAGESYGFPRRREPMLRWHFNSRSVFSRLRKNRLSMPSP